MTIITVTTVGHGQNGHVTTFSHDSKAAKTVRLGFNPSTLSQVDRLKLLAAAFVQECEFMQTQGTGDPREAAIAITLMQQTCMMAVAAATSHLNGAPPKAGP